MKLQKLVPSILSEYNQKWLTTTPWLWETKIHYVVFYAGLFNLLVFASTCLSFCFADSYGIHFILPASLSILSTIGIGTWLYALNNFSIERSYGKHKTGIIKKRFLLYFTSFALLMLPVVTPLLISLGIRGYFYDAANMFTITIGLAFLATMLLDIWKQVGKTVFFQTIVLNTMVFVGLMVLIDLSIFFVVLLTLIALFSLPILISSLETMTEIQEYKKWRVIGIASFQFLSPFLLTLALTLVLIPLSLVGEVFFIAMGGISAVVYVNQFLTKFSKIHRHFYALPKHK